MEIFCIFSGSINDGNVFTLRGKHDNGSSGTRRSLKSKRTTTSTSTTASSSSSGSSGIEDVASAAPSLAHLEERLGVEASALFGTEDDSWRSNRSGDTISLLTNTQNPVELVVKPLAKAVLPCELEGNYTLLMPAVRCVFGPLEI